MKVITAERFSVSELMKPLPPCVDENASVLDATIFLINSGITAAPVVSDTGRVVGVITLTHILSAQRGTAMFEGTPDFWPKYVASRLDFFERTDLSLPSIEPAGLLSKVGEMRVRDAMSHEMLAIDEDAAVTEAAETMVAKKVHRLFVTNAKSEIIGVISAYDILRCIV